MAHSTTDTGLLISILVFYGLLAVVIPIINLDFNQSITELNLEWNGFNIITSGATLIYYSIGSIPLWLGIIFALPSIVLGVIIYKLVRGIGS
jgi:hypothetical protein